MGSDRISRGFRSAVVLVLKAHYGRGRRKIRSNRCSPAHKAGHHLNGRDECSEKDLVLRTKRVRASPARVSWKETAIRSEQRPGFGRAATAPEPGACGRRGQ